MRIETFKWIFQRVSTPFILFLYIWLIYNAYQFSEYKYNSFNIFFNDFFNLCFSITFFVLLLLHTSIEVFHCIHDYFSKTRSENIIKFIVIILYGIILLSFLFFLIQFII